MLNWFIYSFQDRASLNMVLLTFLHDHIMSFIIIITILVLMLIGFVISYSFSLKHYFDEHLIESLWTFIPVVILMFLAIPSIKSLYYLEDTTSSGVSVKSVGNQWYWTYQYIENMKCYDSYIVKDITNIRLLDTNNSLILPYSMKIQNLITATDVIHSWALPRVGTKVDAIPGRINQVFIYFIKPGVFYGQCSEICGANHSFIPIKVHRVHITDFCRYIMS